MDKWVLMKRKTGEGYMVWNEETPANETKFVSTLGEARELKKKLNSKIGSATWLKKQIREFEREYEKQTDEKRCLFIDGKLTILKLWLQDKEGIFAISKNDASKGCGKEFNVGTEECSKYICGKTEVVDYTGDKPKPKEIWLCEECVKSQNGVTQ